MGVSASSPKSFEGDVVLVTGGTMGIGRLLAIKFAALGAHVVIWGRNQELGASVVEEIKALGPHVPKAHFYRVDVTDRELVYKTAEDIKAKLGGVDILINNAGVLHGGPLLERDDAAIEQTLDVNATAHFWTTKAFLPAMIRNNKGNIVSVSSAGGIFGTPGMVDYCASKFASVGFMVSLRQELQAMGKDGVHCTLVCPSWTRTNMTERVNLPRGSEWLTAEEVADAVISAVRKNQWRVLLPRSLYVLEGPQAVLPDRVIFWGYKFVGANDVMKNFNDPKPEAVE